MPLGNREGKCSDDLSQETCLMRGISDLLSTDLLSGNCESLCEKKGESLYVPRRACGEVFRIGTGDTEY